MVCVSKNKSYLKSQNLKIFGQGKLNGIVEISGAKNSALVLLASSLLTNEKNNSWKCTFSYWYWKDG